MQWAVARCLSVIGAAIALAIVMGGPTQSETEIRISSWVSPKHPANYGGYRPFMEAIQAAADDSISFRLFEGGALLGAKTTLSGVRDGIADVGLLALTYHPAEFPHAQLLADLAMFGVDPPATAAAITELNLLHCPPCLQEFAAQNLVYGGTYSSAPYVIIGTKTIASLADLKGARVRTPGRVWDRWATQLGAVPVSLPSTDMFEGLERGIVDVVLQPPAALRSYGLRDVASHVTLLDLGTYHVVTLFSFNRDTWGDLNDDQRQLLLDHAALGVIGVSAAYTALDAEVIAESAEDGITFADPSEELRADRATFAAADLAVVADTARADYGIAEPEPIIDLFRKLTEKWRDRFASMQDDPSAMAAALKAEVFDQLDASNYGM